MSSTNFKQETLDDLKANGKKWSDVKWIGKSDGSIRIHPDVFLEIADRNYDSGFGSNEVNNDIVVVGDDWWLSRWEYDGSEGWEFCTIPTLQPDYHLGKGVFVKDFDNGWEITTNLEYL